MTRKRFIKLLMSHGYKRNYATFIAWEAWKNYESYQDAWERRYEIQAMAYHIKILYGSNARDLYHAISEIYENIRSTIADMARSFAEMHAKIADCADEGEHSDDGGAS